MFQGAIVALVTPFKEGRVDEEALCRLIEAEIEGGVAALVPCGTTGEGTTLSPAEWRRVIEITRSAAGGRVPVIAGCGTNDTAGTIERTRLARSIGADGGLVITPYYNRPTQEGLFAHFSAVAHAVDLPLVLYNVPGRTGVHLEPATIERLIPCEGIVAVKEATGSMKVLSEILSRCGDRFSLLSGEDATILPFMAAGGNGVISVVANVVPGDVVTLCNAVARGDLEVARGLHLRLFPLVEALFCETNPIPVKAALGMLGCITPEVRLPLTPISEGGGRRLRRALADYGLIEEGGSGGGA